MPESTYVYAPFDRQCTADNQGQKSNWHLYSSFSRCTCVVWFLHMVFWGVGTNGPGTNGSGINGPEANGTGPNGFRCEVEKNGPVRRSY